MAPQHGLSDRLPGHDLVTRLSRMSIARLRRARRDRMMVESRHAIARYQSGETLCRAEVGAIVWAAVSWERRARQLGAGELAPASGEAAAS